MTEPAPVAESAAPAKQTRRETVARLRHAIQHTDPGTVASLRRFNGDSVPPAAFYRLTVGLLDEILPEAGPHREAAEQRWAVIAAAMASAQGFLSGVPLGEALAKAKVAEMRVLRLLEARAAQLPDLVRNVVHQLVQKGQSFDSNDLANLLLAPDDDRTVRGHIARLYYRHAEK